MIEVSFVRNGKLYFITLDGDIWVVFQDGDDWKCEYVNKLS